MSGAFKTVKKAFKKVGKFIKKIVKPVAIAVAAYFTAGVALSFIPATSAFAASLPGFAGGGVLGTGIGAGATAGTGIFSSAANIIGLGGGLAKGAAAIAAPTAAAATPGIAAVQSMGAANVAGAASAVGGGATATGAGVIGKTAAAIGGMSVTDKLLLAKVGTDVAGALFGPTPEDDYAAQAEEAAKFRGAFYGMEAGGQPQALGIEAPALFEPGATSPPQGSAGAGTAPLAASQQPPVPSMASSTDPLFDRPEEEVQQQSNLFGTGQMKTQIPVPTDLFAPTPGVRYV